MNVHGQDRLSTPAARSERAEGRERTVLVVEDHVEVAEAIQRNLLSWGYHALVALDGAAAMAMASAVRPDAILLDLALPGSDGFEILERLRGVGVTAPVVVVTAFDDSRLRAKALELETRAYLVKPLDYTRLRGVVEALFASA